MIHLVLGNRVVYALQVGLDEAMKQGLTVEAADALMGRLWGFPNRCLRAL